MEEHGSGRAGEGLDHLEHRLARWRREAFFGHLARESARALAVGLAGAGVAALLARALGGASAVEAAWAALFVVPALVIAVVRARRRVPDRAAAAAAVDLATGGSGLVLLAAERRDAAWASAAAARARRAGRPAFASPALPWSGAGAAAIFLLVALAVPMGATASEDRSWLDRRGDAIAARIAALAEDGALAPEKAERAMERLAALREKLPDLALEAAVEALDRMSDDLADVARDLARDAENRVGELSEQARKLAESAMSRESRGDVERRAGELADALSRAASLAASSPELARRAAELAQRLAADPKLADLASALALSEELRALLEERLANLADRGLLESARLARGADAEAARAAFERLAEALARGEAAKRCPKCVAREACERGECPSGDCDGHACEHRCGSCEGGACSGGASLCDLAGSPGGTEGGGAAPLSFEGEGEERDRRFRTLALERIGIDDPESEVQRLSVEAETPAIGERVDAEGLRLGAGDGTGRRHLAPRHRAALEAFQRRSEGAGER